MANVALLLDKYYYCTSTYYCRRQTAAAVSAGSYSSGVVGRTYIRTKKKRKTQKRYMKASRQQMNSLLCRTLATSPRPIEFDRREAPLPLWLSEALRVARAVKGEHAGARFTTRPNRAHRRHRNTDEHIFVF